MQFKVIVLLSVLFAGASAQGVCPGFNYAIADLGDQTYFVYDDSCNDIEFIDLRGKNACTDGPFVCTPPPVSIQGAEIQGNQYACRSDSNSGSCNGHTNTVCCRNDGR